MLLHVTACETLSGLRKFCSSPKKDFLNAIGTFRTCGHVSYDCRDLGPVLVKRNNIAGSPAQRRQASARCAPDRLRSSRAPRGRARRMWGPIPHSQVTFSDVRDDGFVGSAECAIIHAQIEVGSLRFDARQQQRPVSWFRSPGRLGCGSFVSRHALVSQKALVGSAVHQGAAFLTGHASSGRFDHGDFVFGSAIAFMRSG